MLHVKFFIFIIYFIGSVFGHGRLWDPPARSTMWRKNFNTPQNYNDNELFCGGFNHQWNVNGGKCGICGDPYDGERHNEAGGKYATGKIAANYTSGQNIDIAVQITANHLGWFEFRLCPNNNPEQTATQSCLDTYKLNMADGTGSRYYISSDPGMKTTTWKLPEGLVCSQCVLQWKYRTGNSWGTNATGYGCLGCGPQEEFYGCSDIAIFNTDKSTVTPTTTKLSTTTASKSSTAKSSKTTTSSSTTTPTTMTSSTTTPSTFSTIPTSTTRTTIQSTTIQPTSTTTPTSATMSKKSTSILTTILQQTTAQTTTSNAGSCVPTGIYAKVSGMANWCTVNCVAGYCPSSHCICTSNK